MDFSFLMSGWGAMILAVIILVVLFAVYYETVGYYIQIGWDKLDWSRKHHEKVEIDVPGGPSALLTPVVRVAPLSVLALRRLSVRSSRM